MDDKKSVASTTIRMGARWVMIAVLALPAASPVLAQDSAIQEKMAAVKQAMAANAQKLHQYQWIETTQLTLKGDPKPSHHRPSPGTTERWQAQRKDH